MHELLGRPPLEFPPPTITGKTILVTGAEGFIGQRVCAQLRKQGARVYSVDHPDWDILGPEFIGLVLASEPDAIIHLAAHKYAPLGEEKPYEVADLNIRGTHAVIEAAAEVGARVVLASTCKAADPSTAYGASKLIAERIALNAGGVVIRLVNVLGSSGSVLPIWSEIPDGDPLPLTPCYRMWMTPGEAVGILLAGLNLVPGRYAPNVPPAEHVQLLARRAHAGRDVRIVPYRRGDRPVERLLGENQAARSEGPLLRITDIWEPLPPHPADVPVREAA